MKIGEFYDNLRELYPDSLSCPWDNDGLMCCSDRNSEVKRVLVSLDATSDALDYAAANGFDTLLTHHPMIFRPVKSVTDEPVTDRIIKALSRNISVISLHTRLDAGAGGVNDTLCDLLGLSDVTVFGDDDCPSLGRLGTAAVDNAEAFAELIKEKTGAKFIRAAIAVPVRRVAVIGGSGGDLAAAALRCGADTLVTGEAGYNDMIDFAEAGLNIFEVGHYETEFPVCETLRRLAEAMAGAEAVIYDPLNSGNIMHIF